MIAIYARQSVDKKDSVSIEGQIDLCKRECDGEYTVYQDKGYSGKNTDRPAFQKLMQAVERGEISKIVVYRLDRISRSITDFGSVWDTLREHGTEFVSVNEKFDTSTPVGRAMVYIIMVFAQLERETIAERIKDNYYQRAQRGAYLGGPAPYGFDIERTTIGGKAASMLVPNKDSDTVKEIFRRYSNGRQSLGKIAAWLTEIGVPGIGRKTWDNVSIARILHNPSYVRADADVYFYYKQRGAIMYNDVGEYTGKHALWLFGKRNRSAAKYTSMNEQLVAVAHHEGIIDAQIFLTCQHQMAENKQIKRTGSGKYSWLSGLIKCGYCGYSMRVVNGRGHLYFVCSGKTNLHLCTAKHEHAQVPYVEAALIPRVQEQIDKMKDSPVAEDRRGDAHNAEKIELAKIEEQIGNLLDALANANGVAMQYINERLSVLDQKKRDLLSTIGASQPTIPVQLPDRPFSELDFESKKQLCQSLINKILLTNAEVTVDWKY
ncbi:MAG: recombinase family protein [Ethanoligenens sp.]